MGQNVQQQKGGMESGGRGLIEFWIRKKWFIFITPLSFLRDVSSPMKSKFGLFSVSVSIMCSDCFQLVV